MVVDDLSFLEICAKQSCSGKIHVRLARRYLKEHEWGKAALALEQALRKGQLEDRVSVMLLLADVHLKLDHKHLAREYYQKATQILTDPRSLPP